MNLQPRQDGITVTGDSSGGVTVARAGHARHAPPCGEGQLVAGFVQGDEQWSVIVCPDMPADLLVLPAYRKVAFVGVTMAAWINDIPQLDLWRILTEPLVSDVEAGLDLLHPYAGQPLPAALRFVVYNDDVIDAWNDCISVRRTRVPHVDSWREIDGVPWGESSALIDDVMLTSKGVIAGPYFYDHSSVQLKDRVVVAASTAFKKPEAQHQVALASALHDMYFQGGDMGKRTVEDVSQYGPDLGYSTERVKGGKDVISDIEKAAWSLVVQAGSINEGGRKDAHVELFMERLFELEGQLAEVAERLDKIRDIFELARTAVGRQVMGAGQ